MHEQCSPAVWRTIERVLAHDPALRDLPCSQLLIELIAEEDGRAAVLLAKHGLAREGALERLAGLKSSGISVDRLIADARALAREHEGEGTVTSEFFLLTLLEIDATAAAVLDELGLNRANLEGEITGATAQALPLPEPILFVEPTEQMAAGRIIDASANRAREALRILDDYCRFVLDDPLLTREVKQLRHDLSELLERLPARLLSGARETLRDTGVAITTNREMVRTSTVEIAIINLKRLQEALRSLEEFGKLLDADLAAGIESIRYRAYTIEKALRVNASARERLAAVQLCVLLTGAQCSAAFDWTIEEAAGGGARMFQLREKNLDDHSLLERAHNVRRWTRKVDSLFIVNDRPDIARLVDADGVHLGQDDMPVHEARKIVGADALIGVSTHSLEQVRQAILDGAEYIGIGPTYPSTTKSFEVLAGPEFVAQAVRETSLPAFAIGGINATTIEAVVKAGAKRIAVSAAVAQADDPRLAAAILCEALNSK
jgi:thiamine-phosphate pyrophosphorylase